MGLVNVVKMTPGWVYPFSRTTSGPECGDAELHREVEGCRGLSPADSPCTGQNAETRSNGAPLGRPMMLFLTPILNMPGAAGFSAQGSLLLYDGHNINTGQLSTGGKGGLDK